MALSKQNQLIRFTLDLTYKLEGEFLIPKGKGPFTTVILVHGFLGFMHQKQFKVISERLVAAGYAVCRFDFSCGQGESEGAFEQGRISNWKKEMFQVISYVKQQSFVSKIVLLGHSLGGALALQQHVHADALITLNGVYRFPYRLSSRTYETPREGGSYTIPTWFIIDALLHLRLPPLSTISCPVLVMQSTNDSKLRPVQAEYAVQKLKHPELCMFESPEHTLREMDTLEFVTSKLIVWLKRTVR